MVVTSNYTPCCVWYWRGRGSRELGRKWKVLRDKQRLCLFNYARSRETSKLIVFFKYEWKGRNTHRASSGPPSYFGRLLFHLDQFHHLQLFWSKRTSNLILNTFWWSWIDLPISMADIKTLLGRHAPMVAAVIASHQVLPRWPAVRLHCCWGRCSPTCWWWSPCWCRARRGQWGEEGRRGGRSPQRFCFTTCGDQLVLQTSNRKSGESKRAQWADCSAMLPWNGSLKWISIYHLLWCLDCY